MRVTVTSNTTILYMHDIAEHLAKVTNELMLLFTVIQFDGSVFVL